MRPDVRQPQRARVTDQLTEDAVTARQVADGAAGLVVDPARQEPCQPLAPLVQHAERRVLRAGELAAGLDHAFEDELELRFLENGVAQTYQRAKCGVLHLGDSTRCQAPRVRVRQASTGPAMPPTSSTARAASRTRGTTITGHRAALISRRVTAPSRTAPSGP